VSVAVLAGPGKGSSRRSGEYRRRGPGRRNPLVRVLSGARGNRRRRSSSPTASQWALIAVLAPAVGLVVARRRLHVPPAVTLALASAAPLVVVAATPRRAWRDVAVCASYMWTFTVTWTLPYDEPEKLRKRLRIQYPITIDSVIGLGVPPTLRLQRALRDPSRVTLLDRAVTLAYGSWFVPHVLLAWLMLRHEQYVPRAAGRLAAAYHLTTPFYYLVPTAPPWWASEQAGLMGGEVQRVRRHALNDLAGKPRQTEDQFPGNPWASMPSDHVASAAITAMGLAELGPIYGAIGWTYVALASFAVVYLGEHYVIDALVGLAIAEAVHRGEATMAPVVRRVVLQLDRLAA
jgi:membrane-associated phospholipid phosphatase